MLITYLCWLHSVARIRLRIEAGCHEVNWWFSHLIRISPILPVQKPKVLAAQGFQAQHELIAKLESKAGRQWVAGVEQEKAVEK
jgi:hypothetical protein